MLQAEEGNGSLLPIEGGETILPINKDIDWLDNMTFDSCLDTSRCYKLRKGSFSQGGETIPLPLKQYLNKSTEDGLSQRSHISPALAHTSFKEENTMYTMN